jgi:hypothetical protein
MAKLSYPFTRAQYDFLEGYVYIQEEAISERLDKVDPNWSIAIDETIAYGDSIVVRSTLTVKGVSRSNSGGNPVQREKKDKTILGQYAVADNGVNAYKAAATDAFKRCARMFGIGRNLLSAPKEGGAFDKWLEQEHTMAKARLELLMRVDTSTGEVILVAGAPPPLTVKAGATVTAQPVAEVTHPNAAASTEPRWADDPKQWAAFLKSAGEKLALGSVTVSETLERFEALGLGDWRVKRSWALAALIAEKFEYSREACDNYTSGLPGDVNANFLLGSMVKDIINAVEFVNV